MVYTPPVFLEVEVKLAEEQRTADVRVHDRVRELGLGWSVRARFVRGFLVFAPGLCTAFVAYILQWPIPSSAALPEIVRVLLCVLIGLGTDYYWSNLFGGICNLIAILQIPRDEPARSEGIRKLLQRGVEHGSQIILILLVIDITTSRVIVSGIARLLGH
jgi:hypothetical protein